MACISDGYKHIYHKCKQNTVCVVIIDIENKKPLQINDITGLLGSQCHQPQPNLKGPIDVFICIV